MILGYLSIKKTIRYYHNVMNFVTYQIRKPTYKCAL